MEVTFLGAVREVTGSLHMICAGHNRVILDCGMFQGRRKESAMKNLTLPFDPRIITNMVLSHAHIDHSGRIPLLVKNGFVGRIVCTRATASAGRYLLLDSAHIQESDAKYLNYKTVRSSLHQMKTSGEGKKISAGEMKKIKSLLKKGKNELRVETINRLLEENNLTRIEPLYTVEEAERSLSFLDGYPYNQPVTIGRDMTVTLYDAGHILGSAVSIIKARENDREFTIGFTGDYGRFDKPILRDPTLVFADEHRKLDLMIMESTYGDRVHGPVKDLKTELKETVNQTFERGGTLLIPSFAFGRTQELIYMLHQLYNEREVPRIPVYVDSPLAMKLTMVFGEHMEVYDRETHKTFLEQGENPFAFRQFKFAESVEESMALMRDETPHIVIASSGMCEAGRILHHLRYKIHNPRNTILIVGFMAQNTLGRRILEQGLEYEKAGRVGPAPALKFLNKYYPLQARVVQIDGFSAHADKNELLKLLKESNLEIKKIALVHGEEEQSLAMAENLKAEGFDASVPRLGEIIDL